MSGLSAIEQENVSYWTQRAPSYGEINRGELITSSRENWSALLRAELRSAFPERGADTLSVLDIGCGPGFFSILLALMSCRVTGVDLTEGMLKEAKSNAAEYGAAVTFLQMDAQALAFGDASFDLVISRNLTWNLPEPEEAYREWLRVLKPGGLLLNFDANWYRYLFDEQAKEGFDTDRRQTAEHGFCDRNIGDRFDVMERIARRMPLSPADRPAWDTRVLTSLGARVTTDTKVWKKLWTLEEQVNFASTPMFLIRASI